MMSTAQDQQPLVALISGAASGIGLAIARSLLAHTASTYNVLLVDLSPARLETVASELGAEYGEGRVDWAAADVTDYEKLGEAFKKAKGREGWTGRVDVVCGIAGITQVFDTPDGKDPFLASARLDEGTGEVGKQPNYMVIEVNLEGILNTVHLAVAHFRSNAANALGTRGRLVLAGSSASLYPFPNESLYGTAKHGVLGVIRSLAPELQKEGITINGIAPSIVETGIGNPTALQAIREKGGLTPMETVTKGVVEVLLSREEVGRELTGQILELCLSHILIRVPPKPANADVLKCLEMMWPWGEIEGSVGGVKKAEVKKWLEGKGVEVVQE
ncbi:hypothetical protein JCM8547_000141 [Rhodosporidiobolus lusitaniae]